jgi:uncharacterized protein YecE (DUF72 family)
MIRVGPAGWSYPDWAGVVYPPRKPAGFHPLRHVARFADLVEVNSTFYAHASPRHAGSWVAQVADRPGFLFTAKVHRDFTHGDAHPDPAAARAFLDGLAPLAEASLLRALLLQVPVTFRRGPAAVERLSRLSDLFGVHPLVVEVRHRSWFEPEGTEALRGLRVSVAELDLPSSSDHPPEDPEPVGPLGYLRLHGRNSAAWFRSGAGRDERYDWLYGPEDVVALAERARRIAARRSETLVVANNHFRGKAMVNTIQIRSLLAGGPVPAPAELVEAYPAALGPFASVSGQLGLPL